jgi:hypothetical protein
MKKVLCSILIILLLPFTCILVSGCKDDDRNIKNFYKSYTEIVNSTQNLTLVAAIDNYQVNTNSYKIDIDYSKSTKLSSLIDNSTTKYYHLKHFYQQMLDDSLAPLYFFGEKISTSDRVTEKQTKQLYKELDELSQDYINIDYYLGILISSLNATNDEVVNSSYLKKLFIQYEQAITSAGILSATVCNIYFNTIAPNSSFNFSNKTDLQLTDTDLTSITINVRARMHYYKAVYANIYNQLYIRHCNLADNLINHSANLPNYQPYQFISSINDITNKSIEELRTSRTEIYNNIMSLYHIQSNFDLAYQHFNTATSKIAYAEINNKSTISQKNYAAIITQFANGIAVDSYEILNNLTYLLYN